MKFFKGNGNDGYPSNIASIEKAYKSAAKAEERKKKAASRPTTLRDIPKLTKELLMQNSKSTTLKEAQENAIAAAKKLYELCDVGHKSNREVMVASGQYDVIGPLTQCLLHEPIYDHSDNNNKTKKLSPNSTIVTLPHQQPRIEGDGISDEKAVESGNDHASPTSGPTTPTNGEATSESAKVKSITTEKSSSPAATAKTKTNKQQHRFDEKLHFVCLTLNNLSIPHDNKRVMVRERGAKRLIGNLSKVIASGKKEAHLCCIILMNLTFYEPGLTIIGQFSPTPRSNYSAEESSPKNGQASPNGSSNANSNHGTAKKALQTTTTILKRAADAVTKTRKLTPLENPQSLLRILQDLVTSAERGTSDFRWAFGLLANLSRHPENALLLGLTGIPRVAVENLRVSKIPSHQWATNSLEDFSLYFLLHQAEASSQGLKGALEVAVPIMNGDDKAEKTNTGETVTGSDKDSNVGIQSLKATMICAFLGLEWKEFPDHGVIAAGTVSELMGNTFERVGKKQVYTDNDFALRTAVSAYAALAKAAAKADSNEAAANNGGGTSSSSCVHTKIMALPTSVALLFQIINAIALHWGEDNTGSENESHADAYHWDVKAGDLAVNAIMSLLPALLEGTGDDSSSSLTQQACADLSKIFVFFSKKTNSISVKARSAEVAEKLTESASGCALPLLEASYDLCRNFGRHRVKKNFL